MPLVEWKDELSVKIEEIDKQHKLLVRYINELNEAVKVKEDRSEIGKMINRLIVYAIMHFAREEDYFDRYDYPETESHKEAHLKFEEKMNDFEIMYKENRAELSDEILNFLADWLVTHILGSDKKYSKFLVKRGVR